MNKECFLTLILLFTQMIICPPPVISQDSFSFMREGDSLWQKREDIEMVQSSTDSYKKVLEIDKNNYEACWKIARSYFYILDTLPESKEMKKRHKLLGNEGI